MDIVSRTGHFKDAMFGFHHPPVSRSLEYTGQVEKKNERRMESSLRELVISMLITKVRAQVNGHILESAWEHSGVHVNHSTGQLRELASSAASAPPLIQHLGSNPYSSAGSRNDCIWSQ